MYTVTNTIENVKWGATGIEDILQCVKTIIATPVGTVPLNRRFGIDVSLLNEYDEDAFTDYVKDTVHKFEPRIVVNDVKVECNNNSGPIIQVTFDVKE